MLVIPLCIVEYLMVVSTSVGRTPAQRVTQSRLPLITAFLALQLQFLIFPSDPFIGDPLGAHQHGTSAVQSLYVKPPVGEEVPPEDNAAFLSLDMNPSVREGSSSSQVDVGEVTHHCGQPVPCHCSLGSAHFIAVCEVVVMIEVGVLEITLR